MMKMNWTLGALLVAGSFAITAPQARAQQALLGTFTLPVAAHFGDVVLQPGDYSISRLSPSIIRFTGENGTATILASSVDSETDRDHGRLTLANVNGTYALKRFDSGVLGRKFDFTISKEVRNNVERASAPAAEASSIEVALK